MELNQEVKRRREALGITQMALADAVSKKAGKKYSQQALNKLETTAGAGSRFMVYILEVLDELEKERSHPNSNAEWVGEFDPWDDATPLGPDEVEVPMLSEVEIQGGNGSTHAVEFTGAKLRFSRRTLSKAGVSPELAACARLVGDSQKPVMPHGTTIGVDRGDTTPRDGKVYALDHLGRLRAKILYTLPGGGLRLSSYNKEEYPDEMLTADQVRNDLRIIGRIWWWSVLD